MSEAPTASSLSEEQASRVLDRATQLEAQRGGDVDPAELRRVALDAGIPLTAFEQALSEVLSSVEAPSAQVSVSSPTDSLSHRLGIRGWIRKALLGVLGSAVAGLGFAFGPLLTDWMIPYSMFVAILIVCGLVILRRRDRSLIGFESDLGALAAGLTLGWMALNPVDAAGILMGMTFAWIIAAVVGGLAVRPTRDQQLSPPLLKHSLPTVPGDTEEPAID